MEDNSEQRIYTFTDINRYLSGKMSAAEMHDIERAALQDPFLADAIEGYGEVDKEQAEKNLNEITSRLQDKEQQPEVITMPKRRRYIWQIAASAIAVILISIFIFYKQPNKSSASLAFNKTSQEQKLDSISNESTKLYRSPVQDSILAGLPNKLPPVKEKKVTIDKDKFARTKPVTESAITASTLKTTSAKKENSLPEISALQSRDKAITMNASPSISMMDTQNNTSDEVANNYRLRKAQTTSVNTWTTDKGKPFILSEVEEINVGRKTKKITDTAQVKPEGGWQSFGNYLFGKLGKKDTVSLANSSHIDGDLELEFSLTESGSPYDIKVLHAQDSTTARIAADAVQQGPKWITVGKKSKRLNIRY